MILVALAIALVVLWRSRGRSDEKGRGCRWFWAWSLVGAALSFSFLAGFSIGLFVLPLALTLLWLVLRASPRWPESIGFVEGVGVVLLVIAYLNRGYRTCPANGTAQLAPSTAGQSFSCGGFDPHPWVYIGAVVAASAAIAYAVTQRVGERR